MINNLVLILQLYTMIMVCKIYSNNLVVQKVLNFSMVTLSWFTIWLAIETVFC